MCDRIIETIFIKKPPRIGGGINKWGSFNYTQFIRPGAQADLLAVGEGLLPVHVGVVVQEVIVVVALVGFGQVVAQLAVADGRGLLA